TTLANVKRVHLHGFLPSIQDDEFDAPHPFGQWMARGLDFCCFARTSNDQRHGAFGEVVRIGRSTAKRLVILTARRSIHVRMTVPFTHIVDAWMSRGVRIEEALAVLAVPNESRRQLNCLRSSVAHGNNFNGVAAACANQDPPRLIRSFGRGESKNPLV